MDGKEKLILQAKALFGQQFRNSCFLIQEEYQKEEQRKAMKTAFSSLFKKANQLEKQISYLGICYLHSSLVTRSYETLLSLYDSSFYLDESPVEVYWKPMLLFEHFEEDIENIKTELTKNFYHIQNYEIYQIKKLYIQYYYAAVKKICTDRMEEILAQSEFISMKKQKNFKVFIGRYQGEAEVVYCMEEK